MNLFSNTKLDNKVIALILSASAVVLIFFLKLPYIIALIFVFLSLFVFSPLPWLAAEYKKTMAETTAVFIDVMFISFIAIYALIKFFLTDDGWGALFLGIIFFIYIIILLVLWIISSVSIYIASRQASNLSAASSQSELKQTKANQLYSMWSRVFIFLLFSLLVTLGIFGFKW